APLLTGEKSMKSLKSKAHVSPWEAFVRASRRDLYVLFLESERSAREVVETLPEEGIRRALGVPDADITCIRTRLARKIDEKRALLEPFRHDNQGVSLAQAARHIAEAWAESDAGDRRARLALTAA
ncbi:MAG TPA: hypothetical protein VFZ57_04985, partial [Thermoanaerobaculia bacterium]|nr:hypothetical protein [Thermoanaerobaculia bacterium]